MQFLSVRPGEREDYVTSVLGIYLYQSQDLRQNHDVRSEGRDAPRGILSMSV